MNGFQITDFKSVIDEVYSVRSRDELVSLTEHVDNEFLNKNLTIADNEWPLFNDAVKQKLENLS